MNEFNRHLYEAQRAQRRTFIAASSAILAAALLIIGLVGYLSGTAIDVEPKDAAKTAQVRVVDGLAAEFSQVIYSLIGDAKVLVSADGFKSETIELNAENRGTTRVVKLTELPGRLIARSEPNAPKNRWTLNGQQFAISPALDHTAPAGTYKLELDNRYFEPVSQNVVLERGKTTEIIIQLSPVAGELSVSTLPEGANVHVNGKLVGVSPITSRLNGGTYSVEASKEGFEKIEDRVEITNIKPAASRNYRMERMKGSLSFDVKPNRGVLLVNGRKYDPSKSLSLAAGVEHQIRYARDGYFATSKKITLNAGETQTVRFRLKPEIGTVQVRSKPSSTVFVDGADVGKTPLTLKLKALPHRIALKRDQYRTVEKTIIPSHKHVTVVDEVLGTEQSARLSEAPNNYKTDTGISLQLFKPTGFQMGAPRDEKGQRANEFLRSIKLTRPFYASRHEITRGQFGKFNNSYNIAGKAGLPVTSVTWMEAVAFCNWLSRQEKLKPFYEVSGNRLKSVNPHANGYRLLSEAEWEWLARRAGRTQQTVFTWGDKNVVPPKSGNIADESARGKVRFFVPNYTDGHEELAPVGSFPPEPSGLYDLTGNASEWVHDVYSLSPPAAGETETDPLGPTRGSSHVVKGSSWRSGTRTTLRASYRDGEMGKRVDLGFRIGRYL